MYQCDECQRPNDNGYAICDECDNKGREERRRAFIAMYGTPKNCWMCDKEMPPWRDDPWCQLCAGAYENRKMP